MPNVSGASAVNTRVHTQLPQRTRGFCGCIGHPVFPAPSVQKAKVSRQNLGRVAPRSDFASVQWIRAATATKLASVIPGWSEGPDPESRDSGFDGSHRPRNDGLINWNASLPLAITRPPHRRRALRGPSDTE